MKSGKTTEARDQVFTTLRSLRLFISWTRPRSRASTNGPFLTERDMLRFLRYDLRCSDRTTSRFGFLPFTVRYPIAGLPHGVLGGMPVGDLPSPPPCGWSRGLSLIHISEPTRRTPISYAVFCLKKKKT